MFLGVRLANVDIFYWHSDTMGIGHDPVYMWVAAASEDQIGQTMKSSPVPPTGSVKCDVFAK